VRCLLHAAALDDRGPADLYRWSHAPPAAKEAIVILSRHAAVATGWDRALDAIVCADERMRDSTWAMVANTFAPLADPDVLDAVSPSEGEGFDPATFLRGRSTLYLLGTASGASATANLVAALAEDVVEAARRTSAASPGSRLDPPLAVVLDEAANYPLPSLPALMSEGGGSGITPLAVLQSLSQARDRWGREAAGAIWDAAIVKIVLGGSANADDLADLSRLIGDRAVKEHSETVTGWGAGRSVSTTVRNRPILEPADIRRIGMGFGLLLLRSAPPIMMTLSPWTARKDAHRLTRERSEFELAVRSARTATSEG
jgi:type IV secretory pathway TraG/TraD family ATPase VirD4